MPRIAHSHPEPEEREAADAALDEIFGRVNCVNGNASPSPSCDCVKCRGVREVKPPRVLLDLALWEVLELTNGIDEQIGKAFAREVSERDPQRRHACHERTERLRTLSIKLHNLFS